MNKIQKLANRLKKIKDLRINKLYKICEQEGLTAQEIEAIKHLNILNSANQCLTNDTYFVLDKYVSYNDDDVEIVEGNITDIERN